MVLVLPKVKGFGEQLGESLGGGIQRGADFVLQMGMEKFKQNQRKKLIEEIEGLSSKKPTQQQPSQEVNQQFLDALPQIENQLGRELTPQDLDQIWKNFTQIQSPSQKFAKNIQEDPAQKARLKQKQYAAMGEHELARQAGDEAKSIEKRQAEERGLFGKEAEEFWGNLAKQKEKLPSLENSLEAQLDAVLKGDVDPWSRGHIADIARSLGAPSSLIAPLETPGSKEFKTGLKTYLAETLRDAFRGSTTGREIDLAEGLLAQAGVSREGNLASLWLLQSQTLLTKEKIRIANDLKKQGVSGYEIPDLVFEQLQPYRKFLSDQYMEAINQLSSEK